MSRNLCKTICDVCGSPVRVTGAPRLVTNVFGNFSLADAECVACRARYSAWFADPHGSHGQRTDVGFYDLSYRASFNDEPGEGDVPSGEVKVFRVVTVDGRPVHVEAAE